MTALGVRIRDDNLSLAAMGEVVATAEDCGYESAWLPESAGRDALAELLVLVGGSKRIQIGTGILPVFNRLPTLTAATVATAATIAPGRVILGLGIGHQDSLVAGHGVKFSKPLAHTREFTEITRTLLRDGEISFHGEVYDIEHQKLACPAPQAVPVYIAALRPAMLRMTGAVADGVLMNWATPQQVRKAITLIQEGAKAAGRDPSEIRIASYLRTCVTDDPERVEKASRTQIARYGSLVYYRRYFAELGFAEQADAMEQAWKRNDAQAAADVVDLNMIKTLTIYGTAEQCRDRLAEYRDAGLDLPIIAPFPIGEPIQETFTRTIKGCAP